MQKKFATYIFIVILIAIFLFLFLISVFITTSSGVSNNARKIKVLEEKVLDLQKKQDLKK